MPEVKKNKDTHGYVEDNIVKKIELIKAKKKESLRLSNNSSANNSTDSLKKKKKKKKNSLKDKQDATSTSGADAQSDCDDSVANESSETLMLKDIIDLGGTQDDYDMLQNVSDNEDALEIDDKDSNFNVAELITFMKSNGLRTTKKSKSKHAVSPDESQEVDDSKLSPQTCPTVPSNPPSHDKLLFKANEPW